MAGGLAATIGLATATGNIGAGVNPPFIPLGHDRLRLEVGSSAVRRLLGNVVATLLLCSAVSAPVYAHTREEAVAMVRRAAEFLRTHDRNEAFAAFDDPHGAFRDGDLYVYVMDGDDPELMMLAHGSNPGLIGVPQRNIVDADGVDFHAQSVRHRQQRGRGLGRLQMAEPGDEEDWPQVELCHEGGQLDRRGGRLSVARQTGRAREDDQSSPEMTLVKWFNNAPLATKLLIAPAAVILVMAAVNVMSLRVVHSQGQSMAELGGVWLPTTRNLDAALDMAAETHIELFRTVTWATNSDEVEKRVLYADRVRAWPAGCGGNGRFASAWLGAGTPRRRRCLPMCAGR